MSLINKITKMVEKMVLNNRGLNSNEINYIKENCEGTDISFFVNIYTDEDGNPKQETYLTSKSAIPTEEDEKYRMTETGVKIYSVIRKEEEDSQGENPPVFEIDSYISVFNEEELINAFMEIKEFKKANSSNKKSKNSNKIK